MRAKWLLLILGAMVFALTANASVIAPCSTLTTGAQLTAGAQCENGDFVYTITSAFTIVGGTAPIAASSVGVSFTGVAGSLSELQFQTSAGSPFDFADGGYSLGYNVQLCIGLIGGNSCSTNSNAAGFINKLDVQSSPPGEAPLVSANLNGTVENYGGGNSQPAPVFTTGSPTLVTVSGSYTPASGDNGAGLNEVTGFTQDTFEQVGPEPGTMALMGGALVGLAAYIRKRRKA